MKKNSSTKSLIILAVLIFGAAAYYFYSAGSPSDDSALLAEDGGVTSDAGIAGARVLSLLNQISSLEINPALFSDPVYTSLVDHTVPIYEQNVGKANPFR